MTISVFSCCLTMSNVTFKLPHGTVLPKYRNRIKPNRRIKCVSHLDGHVRHTKTDNGEEFQISSMTCHQFPISISIEVNIIITSSIYVTFPQLRQYGTMTHTWGIIPRLDRAQGYIHNYTKGAFAMGKWRPIWDPSISMYYSTRFSL